MKFHSTREHLTKDGKPKIAYLTVNGARIAARRGWVAIRSRTNAAYAASGTNAAPGAAPTPIDREVKENSHV